MNIDERIVILVGEINEVQQQTKSVEGQIIILQQRHQVLTFSYARLEGALSAFTEIKNDSEKTEEPS